MVLTSGPIDRHLRVLFHSLSRSPRSTLLLRRCSVELCFSMEDCSRCDCFVRTNLHLVLRDAVDVPFLSAERRNPDVCRERQHCFCFVLSKWFCLEQPWSSTLGTLHLYSNGGRIRFDIALKREQVFTRPITSVQCSRRPILAGWGSASIHSCSTNGWPAAQIQCFANGLDK